MMNDLERDKHKEIVERYRQTQIGDGWHTAPDDGYLYDHLVHHLAEAGLVHELRSLFADHDWLHVRVPQSKYLYDRYLDDLQKAWDVAYSTCHSQIDEGQSLTALVDCFRYALIRTSINSIAADYSPQVIAKAVELGVWTIERAVSIVQRAPSLELYAALLKTDKLDDYQREKFIQIGYQQVIQHRDHWHDTGYPFASVTVFLRNLITMLPHLNNAQRLETQNFELKWLFGYGWGKVPWDPEILEQVAPYLSSEQLQGAIEIAFESLHKSSRLTTIAILLAHHQELDVRGQIAERAYHSISEIKNQRNQENDFMRSLVSKIDSDEIRNRIHDSLDTIANYHLNAGNAEGIARLLPYLPSQLKGKALEAGLSLAKNLEDRRDRIEKLQLFIPHIDVKRRGSFVNALFLEAYTLEDDYGSRWILALMFEHLNSDQREKAFQYIVNFPRNGGFSLALVMKQVFFFLTADQQQQCVKVAYEEILFAQNVYQQMSLIGSFALFMDVEYVEQCLSLAVNLGDEMHYVSSVASFIPRVSVERRQQLAQWVFDRRHKNNGMSSPTYNTKIIEQLAEYLPDNLLELVFHEAVNERGIDRLRQFISILPRLDEHHSKQALDIMLQNQRDRLKPLGVLELCQLVSSLVGSPRAKAINIILNSLVSFQAIRRDDHRFQGKSEKYITDSIRIDEDNVAFILRHIIAYLSQTQLLNVYRQVAVHMTTPIIRTRVLIQMLPYLPDHLHEHVSQDCFDTLENDINGSFRQNLIPQLLPFMSQKMKDRLLEYIYGTSDIQHGLTLACQIAPHLTESDRLDMLFWAFQNATTQLNQDSQHIEILTRLAPLLDSPQREHAVQRALEDLQSHIPSRPDEMKYYIASMTRLLELTEDPGGIIQATQQHIMRYLANQLEGKRMMVYATTNVLTITPVLTSEFFADIADQIIEICEGWRWV